MFFAICIFGPVLLIPILLLLRGLVWITAKINRKKGFSSRSIRLMNALIFNLAMLSVATICGIVVGSFIIGYSISLRNVHGNAVDEAAANGNPLAQQMQKEWPTKR